MPEPILQVDGLDAGYVRDLPILKRISVAVQPGSLTVIIGPNGAGKSTLIKAIVGLVAVTAGSVRFDGQDITGMRPDRLARVGLAYVPQTDNIFRSLTIQQNLELTLRGRDIDMAARIDELYTQFPVLAERRRSRAGVLSGGQRQFVAVAMALATRPRLILMDEPSAGLSPQAAETVLDHTRSLTRQGIAVLLVEQNVKQALARGDHCYVFAEGRNQIDGHAQALLEDPELGRIYLGGRRREPA